MAWGNACLALCKRFEAAGAVFRWICAIQYWLSEAHCAFIFLFMSELWHPSVVYRVPTKSKNQFKHEFEATMNTTTHLFGFLHIFSNNDHFTSGLAVRIIRGCGQVLNTMLNQLSIAKHSFLWLSKMNKLASFPRWPLLFDANILVTFWLLRVQERCDFGWIEWCL